MKKKVRYSLGSYKNKKDDFAKCDTDEVAKQLLHIYEIGWTERIPAVVCAELRILAQAYFHYKNLPKSKLKALK